MIAKYARDAADQIAATMAWRGETDRAFEWLNRALAPRDGGLTLIEVDPLQRKIRSAPRYAALRKKLNLPQ